MKQDQEPETPQPNVHFGFKSAEDIRQLKTTLLFEYLKKIIELNRQLKLIEVHEEFIKIGWAHDRALNELLQKEGK